MDVETLDTIAALIANGVRTYVDSEIPKERFHGVALQILAMLKEKQKAA